MTEQILPGVDAPIEDDCVPEIRVDVFRDLGGFFITQQARGPGGDMVEQCIQVHRSQAALLADGLRQFVREPNRDL